MVKGGSAGGLLALAFAIENKLSMILARRCVVSLGAGAALMGTAKFLRVGVVTQGRFEMHAGRAHVEDRQELENYLLAPSTVN